MERRFGRKKRDAAASPATDPTRPIQDAVQTTGVWHTGEAHATEHELAPSVDRVKTVAKVPVTPSAPLESSDVRIQTKAEAKPNPPKTVDPAVIRSLELPPLPWPVGALAPVISSRALQYHYSHQHRSDVDATNRLIRIRPELAGKTLLDILMWCAHHEPNSVLFKRASHAWNHNFFWSSLSPSKQRPTGSLRQAIARDFGDYDRFTRDFAAAGAEQFGSGWLWLSADRDGVLRIHTYRDAGSPVTSGERCLLAVDLWEHAYYLDHQDRRREYLEAILDRRLDWRFAHNNYTGGPAAQR